MTKRRHIEQYQDMIARLYPELNRHDEESRTLSRTVTFQVTDDCNLACTYCYQHNKGKRKMSFEVAKKAIDNLLTGANGWDKYINPTISPAIVIDFIGGEPFLEVELMGQIIDYFRTKAIELHHPWAKLHCFSICSNGTLYQTEKVQIFLNRYKNHLSFSVTIDGNKELHDSCRIFPDGRPSYDLAVAAAEDWMRRGGYMGSKITIAPGNIEHVADAIIHMYDLGYDEINANCVYEEGWALEHAKIFYKKLKEIADFWNEKDIVETHYLSLFEEDMFRPMEEDNNDNWCGGTGMMLAIDPDGYLYPCLRYMESSIGDKQPPLRIGHVDTGLALEECEKNCVDCLNKITRRSQSTDECFYCPIAEGCSWCSAYNYEIFGTPDARATYICEMHKARSLANVYFWNTYYKKHNINKAFAMHCPKEWAVPIIGSHEYEMLKSISE